jgi:hypothetical protein
VDISRKAEPDEVWLCHATPYPGTELRVLVQSNRWKISDDWKLYNTMNPIFEDPLLPAKEIAQMRKNFYDKFYSPRYHAASCKGILEGQLVQQDNGENCSELYALASKSQNLTLK